jgi:hypothetical protein
VLAGALFVKQGHSSSLLPGDGHSVQRPAPREKRVVEGGGSGGWVPRIGG